MPHLHRTTHIGFAKSVVEEQTQPFLPPTVAAVAATVAAVALVANDCTADVLLAASYAGPRRRG